MFQSKSFSLGRKQKPTKATGLRILRELLFLGTLIKDVRRGERISPNHRNNLLIKVIDWSRPSKSQLSDHLCVCIPVECLPREVHPSTWYLFLEERWRNGRDWERPGLLKMSPAPQLLLLCGSGSQILLYVSQPSNFFSLLSSPKYKGFFWGGHLFLTMHSAQIRH